MDFNTTNWDQEQTATITAVDDGDVEGLVASFVSHAVTIANATYEWGGVFSPSENLTVRVYDDDQAGVILSLLTLYVMEGDVATYTVRLMGSPSANVEVRKFNE